VERVSDTVSHEFKQSLGIYTATKLGATLPDVNATGKETALAERKTDMKASRNLQDKFSRTQADGGVFK